MNGDLGKIYGAINEVKIEIATISTRQEERHIENKAHLEKIDTALHNVEHQPCINHYTVQASLKRHEKWIWFIVTMILLTAVRTMFL